MKVMLIDRNPDITDAWRAEFERHIEDVEHPVFIRTGDALTFQADAIVSPANSFGFMDGGFDLTLRNFYGSWIEESVRGCIASGFNGELLVGQAMVLATGNPQFNWLVVAPTMRVPSNVSTSVNAFLAMKAILRKAERYAFDSILVTGLCTWAGQMAPEVSARQMRAAYEYQLKGMHRHAHWTSEIAFEDYLRRPDRVPAVLEA